jgi:hypothetical protein
MADRVSFSGCECSAFENTGLYVIVGDSGSRARARFTGSDFAGLDEWPIPGEVLALGIVARRTGVRMNAANSAFSKIGYIRQASDLLRTRERAGERPCCP